LLANGRCGGSAFGAELGFAAAPDCDAVPGVETDPPVISAGFTLIPGGF